MVTDWRVLVPADVMEDLFWQAAGPLMGDDEPSAVLLAGMMVLAADGMLVNLADTPANRAMFGSTGTGDDSAPFPQLRVVALAARQPCPSRRGPGQQPGRGADPAETAREAPSGPVRRPGDLLDRNFRGYDLITAILDAGGHVVARVSATVTLRRRPAAAGCPTDPG